MGYAELNGRYEALRTELDAAYAVWNSTAIDQIAEEIAQVELALASAQHRRQASVGVGAARAKSGAEAAAGSRA